LCSSAKRSQRGSDGQNAKWFVRHITPQDKVDSTSQRIEI
jgi:hypothetical protein